MKKSEGRGSIRVAILVAAFAGISAGGVHATTCGSASYPFPYTDVAGIGDPFCPGIMEAYTLGVTKGTSATTFSPNDNVTRLQMTTFLQRSIDQGLRRSHRRIALAQSWTPKTSTSLQRISLPGPGAAGFCKSDGERVWVGNGTRLEGVLATTGALDPPGVTLGGANTAGVLVANGHIYATDHLAQDLYFWRPGTPVDGILNLGFRPNNLTFDGDRIWTANFLDGTIAIMSVVNGVPQPGATVLGGFTSAIDVLFDGANVWVAEANPSNRVRKLNSDGSIAQTVAVGTQPAYMVFDGANIWVPNHVDHSITVIQASSGAVVATLTSDASNRLSAPLQAAFDGERILVTNLGNDSVTLFRAADLSLIRNVQLAAGSQPFGACSDGINFWVTLGGSKELVRL